MATALRRVSNVAFYRVSLRKQLGWVIVSRGHTRNGVWPRETRRVGGGQRRTRGGEMLPMLFCSCSVLSCFTPTHVPIIARSEKTDGAQPLDRCGVRAPFIVQVERQVGWARLWDAALDSGVLHTRRLSCQVEQGIEQPWEG